MWLLQARGGVGALAGADARCGFARSGRVTSQCGNVHLINLFRACRPFLRRETRLDRLLTYLLSRALHRP